MAIIALSIIRKIFRSGAVSVNLINKQVLELEM